MIQITFSSSFKKSFRKRIAGNQNLEVQFWEKVEVFKSDPFQTQLRTHKLSGKLKDLWSFSVEYDLGVIFHFADDGRVIFVDIGTHREVY